MSRFEAMMMKFCEPRLRTSARMTAKVMVVVAMMMQVRFFRNSLVWNFLGMRNLNASRLMMLAMMI